ncbi:MAG: translation initiation factor IF-2 [Candidatus Peribacteraceae bacterium]
MRLIQVAKILGITGQELRTELMQTDFGVKPTDRETTDNLAMGIIRFIARKRGINVDFSAFESGAHDEGAVEEKSVDTESESKEVAVTTPGKKEVEPSVNVLRKLTLEDVPKEAIARQQEALKRQRTAASSSGTGSRVSAPSVPRTAQKQDRSVHQEQIKQKTGPIAVPGTISVKEFAEKAGVQVPKIVAALLKNGILATINQEIDFDTATIVALELGFTIEKEQGTVSVEALLKNDLEQLTREEDPSVLIERPAIVTVMGHVDHGKTAILDAIRSANVVAGEAGGITQHVGAYQVETGGKRITFIDTPGHEAFTAMRARGAQLTDIAILVVSAEEGVKPTTIEAIAHAKDAGVPIIVAINKMDRPNADPDRVKGELAGHGVQSEDWGGTVPMVPCSAVTKQGIPELLDTILLVAEMEELKANPKRPAIATVVESHLDKYSGPLATVVVNTGTLSVGDVIGCGGTGGKVKALLDEHGKRVTEITPSGPAVVSGFDALPRLGDILQVFRTDKELKAYLSLYTQNAAHTKKRGFADLVTRLSEGKLTELKIILKADAQGSLESIEHALQKLTSGVTVAKVIHGAVGDITESDVMMAAAGTAIVIAFNVDAAPAVIKTSEREGVSLKMYDIIYKLLEDVELLLKGLVEPVETETVTGHLEVRGVFFTKGSEMIVGGKVTDGVLKRNAFRIQRGGQTVGQGRITSLKHVEKDIKEAKEGMECGMRITTDITIEMGDVFEVYSKDFVKAT